MTPYDEGIRAFYRGLYAGDFDDAELDKWPKPKKNPYPGGSDDGILYLAGWISAAVAIKKEHEEKRRKKIQ